MELDDLGVQDKGALFAQLAAHSPNVIWLFSADWSELVFVNERYEDIWGRSRDALAEDPSDFLEGVHPDDRDAVREAMQAISSGEQQELEYRVNADEDYGRWVRVHGKPIRDEDGDIVRVAGFCHDVTTEKERKQELERQNARLESFASVVSHDLRNPLNVATGHLALARESCDDEAEHLDAVARAHRRMEELIENLLQLARDGQSLQTRPVDLQGVAEACWADVATDDATLVVDAEQVIEADTELLKQLLENLYRNAVQHGGRGVTVRVGDLATRQGFFVEDDGAGIPREDRERVFEPGFSTAESGGGLGLAIVQDVAEEHGWRVSVTESESGGARFEIEAVDVVE